MRNLAILLVGSLCFLSAGAVSPPHDRDTARRNLLEFACTVMQVDCADLPTPDIEYVQLDFLSDGTAGAYAPGTSTIYVDVDWREFAPQLFLMSVIVHEMAHYVYHFTVDHDYTSCETESAAWHVGNSFLVWVGLPEQADYRWYGRYGCPVPNPPGAL